MASTSKNDLRSIPKMIAFLEDRLSPEEMARAEALVEEDELYAMALESLHQQMLNGELKEEHALRMESALLQSVETQLNRNSAPTRKMFPYRYWLGAASIILLVAAAYLFFIPSKPSPELIFAAWEPRISTKGGSQDEQIAQAVELYQQKRFEQSIPLMQQIIIQDSVLPRIKAELALCVASALLESSKDQQAIDWLKTVNAQAFPVLQAEMHWYNALAYLRMEDASSAKEELQKVIPLAGKSRRIAAENLLQQLE